MSKYNLTLLTQTTGQNQAKLLLNGYLCTEDYPLKRQVNQSNFKKLSYGEFQE